MNLRNVGKNDVTYNIGLDLGTGSVGWAVTDENGDLFSFKGKTTWGSRIFPAAETAANARLKRGQRRRYARRRWRLDLLQQLFEEEIGKVDPDFFIRLRQSRLLKEDKTYLVALSSKGAARPLFAEGETEADYYKKYPTIYHLRKALMEQNEQADIRLIYLAFHNIVKARGNFLYQDNPGLRASNANMGDAVEKLCLALEDWCELKDLGCDIREHQDDIQALLEGKTIEPSESNGLKEAFTTSKSSRKDKASELAGWLAIGHSEDFSAKQAKDASKELANLIFGLQGNFKKVFPDFEEDHKVYLNKDDQVESFYDVCPDDSVVLFEALQAVYSAYVLMGILKDAHGGSISSCKVAAYDQYGEDLRLLKDLVRDFVPEKYDEFFRGDIFESRQGYRARNYNPATAKGYTKYNSVRGRDSYDALKKEVASLLEGTSAEDDSRYESMMQRFSEDSFLRRLKTSDNGSIPYQLHLEEMEAIIEKQKQYYPFLGDEKEKIESLVTFRIPYYVGPLTQTNAAKDKHENTRFAWSVRNKGKDHTRVYPWNWEEVIDRKASAAKFMERLTGTCTYLLGEPVLPRHSLLYEEYCVLNELNGARCSSDGDTWYRFSHKARVSLVEDLFQKKKGAVTYKTVEDWLKRECHYSFAHVKGGQGENGFESKLSSYMFFKDILNVDELDEAVIPMIEEIIWWNTLFEDRFILKESIQDKYGSCLTDDQINKICKKRFTGWGRLSKRLLCGIKAQTDNGPYSIMDILREGNPNNNDRSETMVFMEILRDDTFGFSELVEEENKKKISDVNDFDVNDLPGSPSVRRTVNQAKRIVDEIVEIAGKPPQNIFIEVAREEDGRNKGRRTKRRYDSIKEAIKTLKKEHKDYFDQDVANRLGEIHGALHDERLALYFMQNGKCMYCGKDLEINELDKYQVDHILPQSYVKDDSFENKALVHSEHNQRKSDSMLLDNSVICKMKPFWEALLSSGLIGSKKFKNLTRTRVTDKELDGFIARQMVETSQSMKLTSLLLEKAYSETHIRSVKAAFSSDLRKRLGLVKCREVNDYHHAHDAYLSCEIGQFITKRHSRLYENPIGYSHAVKGFIAQRAKYANEHGTKMSTYGMPGSSSFVISSFLTSGFDEETGEIFKDDWNAGWAAARIHDSLNRRDCYISRMPEETSGAFWDETIYSPKQTKKGLTLPLKKGLDPQKYGSYSREQFAYFFVYEAARITKNGKAKEYIFADVPVQVAAMVSADPSALFEFARKDAVERGVTFLRIVREKVYKYQLIQFNGDKLFITGFKSVRNAIQLSLNEEATTYIFKVIQGEDIKEDKSIELYDDLLEKYKKYAPKLCKQLRLDELRADYISVPKKERDSVLISLISIFNAKTNMINLSAIGSGKAVGNMRLSFSKEMSNPKNDFAFIDQSVTGMFERKTCL